MAPNKRLIKSKNNSFSGTATVKGGKIVKRPTENSIKKKTGKAKVKLTTKELPKKNVKKTPNVKINIKKAAAKSTSKQENLSKATTASNALNKIGTRGKKRSYAELASGSSLKEDYKQVKKQKVSKVSQETTPRGSRNKKPTVKASEWFSTINSKKQGSAKKETIKSSPKNKTSITKSPKNSKIQNSSSKKISTSKAALKTTVKSKTPKKSTKQVVSRKESNSTKKTTQNKNTKITPTKTPSKRKSSSSTPKKLSPSSEVKPKLRKKVTPGKSNQPTKQTIKNITPSRSTRKQSILQPDIDNKESTLDNVIVAEEILKEVITSVIKPPDSTNLEIAESNTGSKFNAEKIVVEEKNVSVEQEEQVVEDNLDKIVTNELDRDVKDRNIVSADNILDTSKAEDIVQNAKEEVCAVTDKESSDCAEENTPVLLNESNGSNVNCSPKNEIDKGSTNSNQVIDSQDDKVLQNKDGINSVENENQTDEQKTISTGKSHISSKNSVGLKPNAPQNITNGVHETHEVKEQSCLLAEQVTLTHNSHISKIDVSIFNNQTVETKEIDTLALCNNANEQEQTNASNNTLEKPLIEKASLELSSVEKNQSSSESDILKELSKINTTNNLSDLLSPTYTKENNSNDDVVGNVIVENKEMKESLDMNLKSNQTDSQENTINDDSFTLRLDSSNGAEDNESEQKDGTDTASNLELICISHEKDENFIDNSVGAQIQDTEQKENNDLSVGDKVIGEISQPFHKDNAESLSVRETTITTTENKTHNTHSEFVAEVTENPRSCENSKDHNIHNGKTSSESDQMTLVSDTKVTEEDDINLVVEEQRPECDPLSSKNVEKPDELASLPVTNEVCEDSVPNMDVAEDSPESMTINSETRSSNRMSIDEDNSPMDLDPESAVPNGNPACISQGQMENEVMEVS